VAEINYDITIDDQNQYVVELNEQGPQGANGEDGNGIVNITKTSTVGLVDTYTINYINGGIDTFTVTNGSSIQSIAKTSTSGLVDTYTITQTNGNTSTFTVTNGSSISSIAKTSTSGLVDTYTVTLTNGNTSTFTVTNGYSPTATVAKDGSETTITITDKNGTTTSTVYDGTLPSEAIKGYLDVGENLTDEKGLADVKNYAHSTFDSSKFTVVGSPTITSDGIASGFGPTSGYANDNYVSTPTITITSTQNAIISFDTVFPSAMSSNQYIFTGLNSSLYLEGNILRFNYNNYSTLLSTSALSSYVGVNVNITIEINAQNSLLKLIIKRKSDGAIISNVSSSFTPASLSSIINIGVNSIYSYKGSIDLKTFLITVDGVPVFSGNKTGVDTIKPDDYTKVGSPTISADGIASGFSSGNYIQTSSITFSKNIEIVMHVNWSSYTNARLLAINNTIAFMMYLNASNYMAVDIGDGSNWVIAGQTGSHTFSTNTDYLFKLTFDGTAYKVYYSTNNGQSYTLDNTITTTQVIPTGILNLGANRALTSFASCSIDLNALQIYVDGALVYQPCLKIPYTQSKTGSKIVNSHYRNRVSDMYNQYGYAPYYTLSDSDYTLPMGELYGLIERSNNLPSSKYDTLTLGTSGNTYTAPADGYFMLNKASVNAGEYVVMTNNDNGLAVIGSATTGGNNCRGWLPVRKADKIAILYTATGTTNLFRFIYTVGSESEA